MQVHKITTYSFSELSEEAQQKAIEDFRSSDGFLCYDWYDHIYEDAKTIGALMGIDIDKIYFSGFSSQGDGACFEGTYKYKKGCVHAVKEWAPQDTELHEIVEQLAEIQKPNFYQLEASVHHSGHYYHSGCTRICVSREHPDWTEYLDDRVHDDIAQLLREFMDWIYSRLEKEYWWHYEDEQVKDSIEANDFQFLEDGSMY